jgi:hypothetical protein
VSIREARKNAERKFGPFKGIMGIRKEVEREFSPVVAKAVEDEIAAVEAAEMDIYKADYMAALAADYYKEALNHYEAAYRLVFPGRQPRQQGHARRLLGQAWGWA